jgi:UDP-GlcNAc:undecaprenyl-phosphate GlcNAc-1-phosphate transferase
MIACQIFSLYVSGVYRGVWERTGLRDLSSYISAVTAGTVVPMLILLFLYRFQSFSRTVFIIYWGFMLILLSLSRLSFRLLDETFLRGNNGGKPTIIYGAGVGGQMAVKEIETNRELGLALMGFIDDNPNIQGRRIQGYPVFGGRQDLERIIKKHHIKKVIISFKKNGEEKKHEIKTLCLKIDAEIEVGQMKLTIT